MPCQDLEDGRLHWPVCAHAPAAFDDDGRLVLVPGGGLPLAALGAQVAAEDVDDPLLVRTLVGVGDICQGVDASDPYLG